MDAHAGSGALAGTATWTLADATGGTLDFLLNAGLRPTGAARAMGRGIVPGTAARLWSVQCPRNGTLSVSFRGHLPPVPSSLPYPPFPLGRAFEGAALGHGRAFFDGNGTW